MDSGLISDAAIKKGNPAVRKMVIWAVALAAASTSLAAPAAAAQRDCKVSGGHQ